MGKAAQKILKNIRATRAAVQVSGAGALTVHLPDDIDVKAIRRRLQMSQAAFAAHFAVELRTVQNWEQGQRRPEGPARVLLQVIDREPEAIMRALQAVA
jgi:putative transcriptional regulator